MIKLSYEQQIAFNSLSIIVGNALYALTVVLFLVPSGLITEKNVNLSTRDAS